MNETNRCIFMTCVLTVKSKFFGIIFLRCASVPVQHAGNSWIPLAEFGLLEVSNVFLLGPEMDHVLGEVDELRTDVYK